MAEKRYINTSLAKALRVLDLFASGQRDYSLTELANRLETLPGSIYAILCTLEEAGYLVRDPITKRYALGLKLLAHSNSVLASLDVRDVAKPVLQSLASSLEANAHLAVLYGVEVLYIDRREFAQSVIIPSLIGRRVFSHCTSLGKVLLAYNPAEREQVLSVPELPAVTRWTVTDPTILRVELAQVRSQGYALEKEEFHEGNICIGAPVFSHREAVIAAISVSLSKSRFQHESIQPFIDTVVEGGNKISLSLGYSGSK